MAGAFVGVADDATAVYWNPAGVATGAYRQLCPGCHGQEIRAGRRRRPAAGERHTERIVALSAPAVGLGYYRRSMAADDAATPAVTGPPSREEVRRSVQALTTSTVGVSLVQSMKSTSWSAVTLKFVHGDGGRASVGSAATR